MVLSAAGLVSHFVFAKARRIPSPDPKHMPCGRGMFGHHGRRVGAPCRICAFPRAQHHGGTTHRDLPDDLFQNAKHKMTEFVDARVVAAFERGLIDELKGFKAVFAKVVELNP